MVKYWTASGRFNGGRERGNERWLDVEEACVGKLEGRQDTSSCFSGVNKSAITDTRTSSLESRASSLST